MKTYKDRENNLVSLAEKNDVDVKLDKTMTAINELPTSQYNKSFLFQVDQSITVGNVTIPKFARGIFISNGNSNDLAMIAIDSAEYIYIGFRNNGVWREIRRI